MSFLQSIGSLFGFGGKAKVDTKWTVSKTVDQFNDCPDEMIFEVFKCLGKLELGRGQRVCKRWSVVLRHNNLWRRIFLKNGGLLPGQSSSVPTDYYFLYESFHRNAALLDAGEKKNTLRYTGDKETLEEFFQIYKPEFYAHLHSLHLEAFSGLSDRTTLFAVKYLISHCGRLERLDFSKSKIEERTLLLAIGFFNLKNYNFSYLALDSDQNTRQVQTVAKTLKKNITLFTVSHE